MMQNSSMWWIIGLIVLFMLGSIASLRVSPREKSLGLLRDKARKLGLQPRLVPAPSWIKVPQVVEGRAEMVAYYSVMRSDAQLPRLCAINTHQRWQIIESMPNTPVPPLLEQPIELKGLYAIEHQSNHVGVYWDESQDFEGRDLEKLKHYLDEWMRQSTHSVG